LSREVAEAQIANTDLTTAEGIKQFAANLEYMKEKDAMTDTLQRDLQSQALTEQRLQFDITTANGLSQWSSQFQESVAEFKLTNSQQYDLATQQLTLARDELAGTQESQELSQIMTIFNNPQVQSYLETANPDAAGQFVEDLLMQAASGDIDFTDTISSLENPPQDALNYGDWSRELGKDVPQPVKIARYSDYLKGFK
jgi:hypothetical protein